MEIALDDEAGPEVVGLVMARQRGYFKDVGLKVRMGTSISSENALIYIDEQSTDFSTISEPEVVMAQEDGLSLIAIRSMVSQSTAALIWLKKSGIRNLSDLAGKTIAVPSLEFEKPFLAAALEKVGLALSDVKVRSVGYELIPALVSGNADAIFGGSSNLEGVQLREKGLAPRVISFQKLGLPPFDELVLIANPARLPSQEPLLGPFFSALNRGTAAAIAHPKAAARALAAFNFEPMRNAPKWQARLQATLPLLSRTGYLSLSQAERLGVWMFQRKITDKRADPQSFLTNKYLFGHS